MEGESGFSGSIIDELHSSDMMKGKVKAVLLEIPLMNFILWVSKDIKLKMKVVLFEVSLMNFILGLSKVFIWKVQVVLVEVSFMNFIFRISNFECGIE